jgi:hypothetical protein
VSQFFLDFVTPDLIWMHGLSISKQALFLESLGR